MRKPFKSTFGKIHLKNGSVIYCTTDQNNFQKVRGLSLKNIVLDEEDYNGST